MKLISWNVNGIRACAGKGLLDYLKSENPDLVGFQEVKATEQENPIALDLSGLGYRTYWNSAAKKGYSGTAILSKLEPISISYGFGLPEHDTEGRMITAEFADFYFVTVYTPNSKRELERLEYRQLWDSLFFDYIKRLEQNKSVIVCGDLNAAHREIDLKNPQSNRGNAGFTDEERAGFDKYLKSGFIDTFRYFYPDKPYEYTWWSNFSNSRAKNVGWRIDYFFISE